MPLGSHELPGGSADGLTSFGGPMVTAGGLVFTAAACDDLLRAFDVETGKELWKSPLPAGGQATPMTYGGRQAVHRHRRRRPRQAGTKKGDSVVAFALP